MMVRSSLSHPLSLLFLFSSLLAFSPDLSTLATAAATTAATTPTEYLKLPLLHRTPFASPSEALSLDTLRLSALHRRTTIPKLPLTSGASSGSGQYYVDLSLGSPPQRLRLVADTGSDLLWVTCSACNNCTHRRPASAFFARRSSSFSLHHCFDSACQLVPHPSRVRCNRTRLHSSCRYEYSYADGSTTGGFFSTETITFNTSAGGEVRHEGLAFGCAFSISGPSLSGPNFNGAQGVMALGRGPISLSSQLGRRFANKFSYCLKDYTLSPSPTSYLMIGGERNDVVARKSAMSYTSLQNNPLSPTFYYIGVQSVSVAGLKLRISPSVWAIDDMGSGGTVVDSGTTLTFLADPAYRKVLAAFNRFVKLPKLAEPIQGFDLCVNVSGDSKPSLPGLSFTLAGGSVFNPPPRNYFVDAADDVKCLALRPVSSASGFSVIGNLMQQGFLLEFDNGRSRLGFSRHGCAIP